MADYSYIEQFLDARGNGLSVVEALVHVAYQQGLITKQEMPSLIEHLNEFGCRWPTDWALPEDKFERVVFLTSWNQWVECIISKLMHNAMIFSMRESDPEDASQYRLIHHFPNSLDELSLEYAVKALLEDPAGDERKLTMHVSVLNRRSLFAMQCIVSLPQREIRKLLKEHQQITIVLPHSGNRMFTRLKKIMQPYGLELRLSRMT